MIEPSLFLAFVSAVTVLMLIPGPNVALITANSVAYGPSFGLLTVAGTSSAVIIQLSLIGLGMTELLGTLGIWFNWLRWIGVGYLIYLGIAHWRAAISDLPNVKAEPKSPRAISNAGATAPRSRALARMHAGLFFDVMPWRFRKRTSAVRLPGSLRLCIAATISFSVASGCSSISARISSAQSSRAERLPP